MFPNALWDIPTNLNLTLLLFKTSTISNKNLLFKFFIKFIFENVCNNMFKTSKKIRFKSVSGQNLIFNLMESPSCLCFCIKNDSKVFSFKEALFIGICAIILSYFSVKMICIVIFIVLYILHALNQILFNIRKEEILIVKGLGYQIKRKHFLKNTSNFIPYEQVQKVFINEVILRHKVIYLLNFLVEENEELSIVPLFRDMLPRLDCLEVIFRKIKHLQDR